MRFQIDKTSQTQTYPEMDAGWQEARTLGEMQIQGWGLSQKTVFGFRQYQGLWMHYVSLDGKQPLWRFLLTGLTPTILLTLLPLMVAAFLPLADPYRAGLGFLVFLNIAISGGDLVLALWFSKSLPLHASVRQVGWRLYWRAETRRIR